MGNGTLTLPKKPGEQPGRLRFVPRKDRAKQRDRLILQELIEDPDAEQGQRWRDIPIVREG